MGSDRKKHKLSKFSIRIIIIIISYAAGGFYFTLGNFSPERRSLLKHVYLVALAKTTYIKKYGMNAILKHIVPDIKILVIEFIKAFLTI